nr:hypothetical protein [Tanacetum cinerariifolium]
MEGYTFKQLKLKEFDEIKEMFDKAFRRVNTFEDFRSELVEAKEKRAGEELIQESTNKQKVEDNKETTEFKQLMEIIPDKKEVAIDAIPLVVKSSRIVDWKIHKEGKKSYYQIMRRRIVGIKSILNAVGITAAQVYVNTAQMELVLLMNFNEEYTKCLLLLVEVKTADTNVNAAEKVMGRIVGIKSILNAVGITGAQVYVNTAQIELVLLMNFNEEYTKCLLLLVEVKTADTNVDAAEKVNTDGETIISS